MAEGISHYFGPTGREAALLDPTVQARLAELLTREFVELKVYPASICAAPGGLLAAARDGDRRKIISIANAADDVEGFAGPSIEIDGARGLVCDANEPAMAALRRQVAYLRPVLTGTRPSVGLGDRLGLATPGHIAAGRDSEFVLVLAQQSIREMNRTGRTPQQVMDEATFGVFECGYDAGFGSDADHLKTPADVDATAAAGFTFFTIDPSDHVDPQADAYDAAQLGAAFDKLIADGVSGAADWPRTYVGKTFTAGDVSVTFDELTLRRAAVKYGRALAHCEQLARHIASRAPEHELEISVDETEHPTSVAEHLFIAHELAAREVKIISLAPRFVGDFEKGIDYKGDLAEFERTLRDHCEIARHYGPYKISVHSGSDKFRIYPIVARVTGGLLHLKTAGTSYLEALRVVARHDPAFLRELIGFCRDHFNDDKATYHISSTLDKVSPTDKLADDDLERVYLDEDNGRQILHVTFGSVLMATTESGRPRFRGRLLALLNREADAYVDVLRRYIGRHLAGLKATGS